MTFEYISVPSQTNAKSNFYAGESGKAMEMLQLRYMYDQKRKESQLSSLPVPKLEIFKETHSWLVKYCLPLILIGNVDIPIFLYSVAFAIWVHLMKLLDQQLK